MTIHAAIRVFCLSMIVMLLSLAPSDGKGEIKTERLMLVPRDAQTGDRFGDAVLIEANEYLVGAPLNDNHKGANAGAVYIFGTGGSQRHKLFPEGTNTVGGQFGSAVHREGSIIAVGAPHANGGTVYLFQWNPSGARWEYLQSLNGSGTEEHDRFGASVVKSGDSIFVGAPSDPSRQGAVYVFRRNPSGSWLQSRRLTGSSGELGDHFGYSIAVAGNTMLIGAPSITSQGSAYLFSYDDDMGWRETTRLTSDQTRRFGESVGLHGTTAVVGAPWTILREEGCLLQGVVLFYERQEDDWQQVQTLQKPIETELGCDLFGKSVAMELSEDILVIGVPGDINGFGGVDDVSGSSRLYRKNTGSTWEESAVLMRNPDNTSASQQGDYAAVGKSVSVHSHTIMVGAPGASPGNFIQTGAVYIYSGIKFPVVTEPSGPNLGEEEPPEFASCVVPGYWRTARKFSLAYDEEECVIILDACFWQGCKVPPLLRVAPIRPCVNCDLRLSLPKAAEIEIDFWLPALEQRGLSFKKVAQSVDMGLYTTKGKLSSRGKMVQKKMNSSGQMISVFRLKDKVPRGDYILRVALSNEQLVRSLKGSPFEFQFFQREW